MECTIYEVIWKPYIFPTFPNHIFLDPPGSSWDSAGWPSMTMAPWHRAAGRRAPMVQWVQGQTPKGQLELDEIEVEDHPIGRDW